MEERAYLFLIPARKGSKGIPGKNVNKLKGKPLIGYTIEYALEIAEARDVCVTSDDEKVHQIAADYGVKCPFVRPDYLSSDTATSYDVILHALDFYKKKGVHYQNVVLLQPTSPLRRSVDFKEAVKIFDNTVEALVFVHETRSNPYYVLFEENENGYLYKSKNLEVSRRQDVPKVYELNGSMYFLRSEALRKYQSITKFEKIKKYQVPSIYGVDIDTMEDWQYVEFLIEKGYS